MVSYKRIANSLNSDTSKMPKATNKESRGDDGLQFATQVQLGVSKCKHDIKVCFCFNIRIFPLICHLIIHCII